MLGYWFMKKILGIIVLSLFLSGNVYAKSIKIVSKNSDSIVFKVKKGMSTNWGVDESAKNKNLNYVTSTAKQHCKSLSKKTYIFGGKHQNISWNLDEEQGGLFSFRSRFICANSLSEAINVFNTQRNFESMIKRDGWTIKYSNSDWRESSFKKINISNNSNTVSSSSGSSTNDKIAQSKQICRDLGFEMKTEKFADCALKMMSIQFEATNKVASGNGTTQEIIVKHQNDYDIFDAMIDVSNAMLSNNKKSSSSSSNRGTNCVIGRTNPTFGTTTMNCN
jgi:hypothetical protein